MLDGTDASVAAGQRREDTHSAVVLLSLHAVLLYQSFWNQKDTAGEVHVDQIRALRVPHMGAGGVRGCHVCQQWILWPGHKSLIQWRGQSHNTTWYVGNVRPFVICGSVKEYEYLR